jgi:hypothetical protein
MEQRQIQQGRFKVWLNSLPANGSYQQRTLQRQEFEAASPPTMEKRTVAISYQVPSKRYVESHSCLLGAELQPTHSQELIVEIAVGYRKIDGGLSKPTANAIQTAFKLLYRLEPSMLKMIGGGTLQFNRFVWHSYEEGFIMVNLALYILRLLAQTDYSPFDDTQHLFR